LPYNITAATRLAARFLYIRVDRLIRGPQAPHDHTARRFAFSCYNCTSKRVELPRRRSVIVVAIFAIAADPHLWLLRWHKRNPRPKPGTVHSRAGALAVRVLWAALTTLTTTLLAGLLLVLALLTALLAAALLAGFLLVTLALLAGFLLATLVLLAALIFVRHFYLFLIGIIPGGATIWTRIRSYFANVFACAI
jgi:hypothetical protein